MASSGRHPGNGPEDGRERFRGTRPALPAIGSRGGRPRSRPPWDGAVS